MKSLPNVTLISYDNSEDPSRTVKALVHCSKLIEFADVILVCGRKPANANGQVRIVPESAIGYRGAMQWEVSSVFRYVATDYALCIHYDGFIINPEKWDDAWLQYDFIGSPWPLKPTPDHPGSMAFPDFRVGNSGFCLKSKMFMQYSASLDRTFDPREQRDGRGSAGDVFTSQIVRTQLEQRGMKYAPVEVAADFGWECNIDEYPEGRPDAFGFHSFNMKNGRIPRL